jgi:hypothetical protein
MKKYLMILLLLVFSVLPEADLFAHTAYKPISEGELRVGLFSPSRYGITDNLEISAHPVAMFVAPNIGLKKSWVKEKFFSTEHRIIYPTPVLKLFSREGTGGLISPEFHDDIPNMFSVYNGFRYNRIIYVNGYLGLVSVTGGIRFAVNSGDLDSRTSIDLPYIYQRMQVYYEKWGLQYGLGFYFPIYPANLSQKQKLYAETDIKIFHFPGAEENLHTEIYLNLCYKHKRTEYSIGGKLIFGEYPFGKQTHLLPMLDVVWYFGK